MSWLQDRARVVAIVNHLGILTRSEQIIKAAFSFGDMIPSQRDHLMEQRGIGETVAEKIIGYGFGKSALPLDGQANRVVSKLRGISENENAVRSKLKDTIPKTAWMEAHELLRLHGQAVCTKNRPSCSDCPLSNCRSRLDTWQGSTHRAQYRAKEAMNSWAEWRQLLLEP
jgi:endonuclease III